MSVDKPVFSKTAHRIFLKLLMKLGCLEAKKNDGAGFLRKNIILGIMPKNTQKIGFFEFCKKNKKKSIDV